jgi:hypothetical protein
MVRETREFWVSDEPEEAIRKAKITLNKLGELQSVSPGISIGGIVSFGMQHVDVKIMWRPEEVETKLDQAIGSATHNHAPRKVVGTMLMMEAGIEDSNSAKAATLSALERFEDAYLHFDRPDFQPDRLGILRISLAVGLLLFLLWRTPAVRRLLPKPLPATQDNNPKSGDTQPTQTSSANRTRITRANGRTVFVTMPRRWDG